MNFETSVSINNLLALKSFRTFLKNYRQHEMPRGQRGNWFIRLFERALITFLIKSFYMISRKRLLTEVATSLVELKAVEIMTELLNNEDAQKAFMSLKEAQPGMFAILYLVQNPARLAEVKTGKDLFAVLSQTELDVALLKNPREDNVYKQ